MKILSIDLPQSIPSIQTGVSIGVGLIGRITEVLSKFWSQLQTKTIQMAVYTYRLLTTPVEDGFFSNENWEEFKLMRAVGSISSYTPKISHPPEVFASEAYFDCGSYGNTQYTFNRSAISLPELKELLQNTKTSPYRQGEALYLALQHEEFIRGRISQFSIFNGKVSPHSYCGFEDPFSNVDFGIDAALGKPKIDFEPLIDAFIKNGSISIRYRELAIQTWFEHYTDDYRSDTTIPRMLFESGPISLDPYEQSILDAVKDGNSEEVYRLLEKGVMLSKHNRGLAVWYATASGNLEMVKTLLKYGSISSDFLRFALETAIKNNATELTQYLQK